MQQIALAVIGGTGVYNLAKLDDVQTHEVDTRFGRPSGQSASASAQNTAAPTSALSQLVSALIRSPPSSPRLWI